MPNYGLQGKAKLANANSQNYFWSNEMPPAGTASVAFQLERQKSASYPWGAAIEIAMSAAPASFEIDVQVAETDTANNYIQIGAPVISLNPGNVARFDLLPGTFYAKFVRLYLKSLVIITVTPNITAVLTR